MKAVLVVDVEEYGDYYVDVYEKYAGDRFDDKFVGRYYLKPMPEKKNTSKIQDFGNAQIAWTDKEIYQNEGWNACIEELEK